MPNKNIKIEDQSFSIPSKILYTCYGYEGCYFSENASSALKEINSTKKKSVAKIYMINSKNTLKKTVKSYFAHSINGIATECVWAEQGRQRIMS